MGKTRKKKARESWRGEKKQKGWAAPSLPSFFPFYFRLRALSIQRTRLPRNLKQATYVAATTIPPTDQPINRDKLATVNIFPYSKYGDDISHATSSKIHFLGVECNGPEKVAYRFTLQKPTN